MNNEEMVRKETFLLFGWKELDNKIFQTFQFYGVKDAIKNEALMKEMKDIYLTNWSRKDDVLKTIDRFKFMKELPTLTNIFRKGKDIRIQATIREDKGTESEIKFQIDTDGLLQVLTYLSLSTLAAYTYYNPNQVPEFETKHYKGYDMNRYAGLFKHPITEKNMVNKGKIAAELYSKSKQMKGRGGKNIPLKGEYVARLLNVGESSFHLLSTTDKYCLVGDLLYCMNIISDYGDYDWKKMIKRKVKADMVKSWEKSYHRIKTPQNIFHKQK